MLRKGIYYLMLFFIPCFIALTSTSMGYIWPLDCPEDFPDDSSQQRKISGLLGEYRPLSGSTPIHFHGGVDIPALVDSPVYSVLTGVRRSGALRT